MIPKLIQGKKHKDERGTIQFNNEFDACEIKRIYTIENVDTNFIRAWQGHSVEKRWFSVLKGRFVIKLIKVDNWESPNPKSEVLTYKLNTEGLHVLFVPSGYVSSIQSMEKESQLLAMSNYSLSEVDDEYRFDKNYFKSR